MRRISLGIIAFLALSGVVGALVTNGWLGSAQEDAGEGIPGLTAPAPAERDVAVSDEGAGGSIASEGGGEQTLGDGAVSATLPGLPELGPAVIRTATLSVRVDEDGFVEAFDAATLVAGRYGGYVQSSSSAGTEHRSGELLIRVPADSFDEAMRDLRGLGTVERQQLEGRDVTSEFVDLEARLRTWETQEAVLLGLMADAMTVEETLQIQRELQDVQFRIEQIKGQLRVLEDQTTFATISLSLREAGAVVAEQGPSTRPSLMEAWGKAIDGFLGVCYAVVVGLGYLVPLALLAALGWVGYRRFGRPRPATP
jgi:hypothetical protein